MKIIRPHEPDFVLNENFPGNLRPNPVWAKSLDPEIVRTTLNGYRDSFDRQKRFDREMNVALGALLAQLNQLWWVVLGEGAAILIVLAIALWRS